LIPEPGLEFGFLGHNDITTLASPVQFIEREQQIEWFTLLRVFEVVADECVEIGGGEGNDTGYRNLTSTTSPT